MTGNPQLGVLSGRLTYLKSCGEDGDGERSTAVGASEERHAKTPDEQEKGHPTGGSRGATFSRTDLHLPQRRSTLLCVLSVPAHMVPTDMLQFVAPVKEQVHSVRILRPCNPVGPSDPARTPAEYMVLLQMESQVRSTLVCWHGGLSLFSCSCFGPDVIALPRGGFRVSMCCCLTIYVLLSDRATF